MTSAPFILRVQIMARALIRFSRIVKSISSVSAGMMDHGSREIWNVLVMKCSLTDSGSVETRILRQIAKSSRI